MSYRRLAVLLVCSALFFTCGSERNRGAAASAEPAPPSAGGTVAIFHEPAMPITGTATAADVLAAILEEAGFATAILSAAEIADPSLLDPARFDILAIPSGESFPAAARAVVTDYLRRGGGLITMGGYAFNDVLREVDGAWTPEIEAARRRVAEAMDRSLLTNGDFEELTDGSPAGWQPLSPHCTLVEESPRRGARCAQVAVPADAVPTSAVFQQELPVEPGRRYRISGWVRTRDVSGRGMAYIAVYQHDEAGAMVEFRDFAVVRGTSDWQQFTYEFVPRPSVRRVRILLGIYDATGTAWFDDIRLGDVTGLGFQPINTATGRPRDGLELLPEQIGIFDASYPLRRVAGLRTAAGQHIVDAPVEVQAELSGWAASGVIGYDRARWVPLLDTFDRYGRPRGPAGALLLNYAGHYAGSRWAYFGVDNLDLFADREGPAAQALQQTARFLHRGLFLHSLACEHRLYYEGEPVEVSVTVDNRGVEAQAVRVGFFLEPADATASEAEPAALWQEFAVPAGAAERVEVRFPPLQGGHTLYRVTALLERAGAPYDTMTTGFVVEQPAAMAAAAALRFTENYFTLDDRPLFLFGTDTYSRVYNAAAENPLTWAEELDAARDVGLNLYEILQYVRPNHAMGDGDWRAFRALTQLSQERNLVFMPGMLIGHNVAIGEEELARQSALCSEYAARLGDAPALLYYINGDYMMQPERRPDEVKAIWNHWLAERYDSPEALRAAWGREPAANWGEMEFPPAISPRWDDVAAVDRSRFLVWLTRRWNEAHVAAIREHDPHHPITSEYYQFSFSGLDLPLTIDGQDVANIGYFDLPGEDIDKLPLAMRFNDLRAREKGLSLGEYGVKTHPAWTVENGAYGYHIVRSEEEQRRLFLAVGHYALGMGASKVQNWCLRDGQANVFPWGLFYPNEFVPKDVAYVHRNQSLVWRHFAPRYEHPAVIVCMADGLRLGNAESLGTDVAYRAFADLLALHYDFGTINDHHLSDLPDATELLVYPAAFAVEDAPFAELEAFVSRGVTLLVSGDFSYDGDRQRTRTERLEQLAGVRLLAANYPHVTRGATHDRAVAATTFAPIEGMPARPCIHVEPLAAEVLAATDDGQPLLVRNRRGKGTVYYLTDPLELADDEDAQQLRRRLYAAVLEAAGRQPLSIEPVVPWLHVMQQPTAEGKVHVVFNTRTEPGAAQAAVPTAAGEVVLSVRNGWPAMAAARDSGALVAVSGCGQARAGNRLLMDGEGLRACLALDGADLAASRAILVAPFEPGHLELPPRPGRFTVLVGEFRSGQWTTLEQLTLSGNALTLDLDAHRATCAILIVEAGTEPRWISHLTTALCRPEQIPGW